MYYYVLENWASGSATSITYDRVIYFWPVPTNDYGYLGTSYPYYYAALDTFTSSLGDAEVPKIPVKYHYALVYYAVHRCLLKAKKFNEADIFYANYADVAGIKVAKPIPTITPAVA
jgi:hypothetical protein